MKISFMYSILLVAVSFLVMFLSPNLGVFIAGMIILGVANSVAQTLIPTILSQETDEKSQGTIMGLNGSYQSIGMIVGPFLGGIIATIAIRYTFLTGAILMLLCFFLSFNVLKPGVKKESAF
jgi:DHA1 family multidrug resistance protein-like MFS transporter